MISTLGIYIARARDSLVGSCLTLTAVVAKYVFGVSVGVDNSPALLDSLPAQIGLFFFFAFLGFCVAVGFGVTAGFGVAVGFGVTVGSGVAVGSVACVSIGDVVGVTAVFTKSFLFTCFIFFFTNIIRRMLGNLIAEMNPGNTPK